MSKAKDFIEVCEEYVAEHDLDELTPEQEEKAWQDYQESLIDAAELQFNDR